MILRCKGAFPKENEFIGTFSDPDSDPDSPFQTTPTIVYTPASGCTARGWFGSWPAPPGCSAAPAAGTGGWRWRGERGPAAASEG